MSTSRDRDLKDEIELTDAELEEGSVEVARLWIKDRGAATCLVNAHRLAEPEMFGTLIFDAIQAAAKAFSELDGMKEGEALRRIWLGLDRERVAQQPLHLVHSNLGRTR